VSADSQESFRARVVVEKIVRNFSRYHKYTLGGELRAKSREIVGVIIAANSRVEKLALLLELREKARKAAGGAANLQGGLRLQRLQFVCICREPRSAPTPCNNR
jgi:hypothetical protein